MFFVVLLLFVTFCVKPALRVRPSEGELGAACAPLFFSFMFVQTEHTVLVSKC